MWLLRRNITIVLLLFPMLAFGQFRGEGNKAISFDYFNGFIYQHKKQISHLIIDKPVGFRLSIARKTYGTESWHERWNYPDVGLIFIYQDYRNDKIGKTMGVMPYFNFYFTKNKEALFQLRFKIAFGPAYSTEKFDPKYNNKNNVLSTDISLGSIAELGSEINISERLKGNTSIAFTHFSNGSLKKPNSGINTVTANIGLTYLVNYEPTKYTRSVPDEYDYTGLEYIVTLSSGAHEATKLGNGIYPFFVLAGQANKWISPKYKLGLATEWFYSLSLKNDIKYDDELIGKTKPDFNRIGISLGHELVVNKSSIAGNIGYYVYDPYKAFSPVYLRLGLRRYISDHVFMSASVKSHGAKAEAAEFAIGYRWR